MAFVLIPLTIKVQASKNILGEFLLPHLDRHVRILLLSITNKACTIDHFDTFRSSLTCIYVAKSPRRKNTHFLQGENVLRYAFNIQVLVIN